MMLLPLVLLVAGEVGMLAAQFSSTPQTATVFKNLPEGQNISTNLCGESCTTLCFLNNQNLQAIPPCIPDIVKYLELNFNNLNMILEGEITDFSEINSLSVTHNQIKEVNWKTNVLPQLEYLDLSHNHLQVVPKTLMLKNLLALSLVGNPISHIGPFAFTFFPSLGTLDLSSTLIGNDSSRDIDESAFALNKTLTQEDSLNSLQVLRLSETYLRKVDRGWSKDLPNLKILSLKKMIQMESLEDDLTQSFPGLELLSCDGSRGLTRVSMDIFRPNRKPLHLSFEDCNLSRFPPFNISISGEIYLELKGNPLICDCELDWLFSMPERLTLLSPNKTFCNSPEGDNPDYSLWEFNNICQRQRHLNQNIFTSAVTQTGSPIPVTPTTQNLGDPPHIPETVTVFKTTAADTTNMSTNQKSSFPGTENGFNESNTTSGCRIDVMNTPEASTEHTTQSSLEASAPDSTQSSLEASKGHTTQSSLEEYSTQSSLEASKGHTTHSSLVASKMFSTPSTSKGNASPTIAGDGSKLVGEDNAAGILNRTKIPSTTSACDYDSCTHLQIPCIELQLLTPCSCPGLSEDNVVPEQPYLKNTSEITDTSAQIHWCSPNSVVGKYQVVYEAVGGPVKWVDNIYVTMRQYTLYDLSPFTTYKVCVLAYNRAGRSAADGGACTEFHTKPSYIMILSIVGALCGLFFVIIVGLAVLLVKVYKNSKVNQYDTRLVSYKNPAFEYHLTIPSYH